MTDKNVDYRLRQRLLQARMLQVMHTSELPTLQYSLLKPATDRYGLQFMLAYKEAYVQLAVNIPQLAMTLALAPALERDWEITGE